VASTLGTGNKTFSMSPVVSGVSNSRSMLLQR
jgi:hypothetical protein